MRKAAIPVFDVLVADPRFENFSVKELREVSQTLTSALVTHSLLKKFEKISEASQDSPEWETRLLARIRDAGEAADDKMLLHDLYMMLHLRD